MHQLYTIQSIGKSVSVLIETVGQILVEQTIIKDSFTGLSADVSTLKQDVSTLKQDVAELRTDMVAVKTQLANHDQRFDRQDEQLDRHESLLQNLAEDIRIILPNHEKRIHRLEHPVIS